MDADKGTSPAHRTRVARYYDQARPYYRVILGAKKNPVSLHLGYWDETVRTHVQAQLRANRFLAELVHIQGGDRVLDMGCGEGTSVIWLARTYGASTVGITLSEEQAGQGRRVADAAGVGHLVSIECMDYLNTSFADGSFDVVWAQESMCHSEDQPAFFAEAYRVLSPGGRLVVEDGFQRTGALTEKEQGILNAVCEGLAAPVVTDIDTAATNARHVGFTDIAVQDITPRAGRSLRLMTGISVVLRPLARAMRLVNKTRAVSPARSPRRPCWDPRSGRRSCTRAC
nr:gamma-tocopherol methyltransferase (EC 2.1.1.95) @ delta-tocopherol methyltransferase (EC 2.1.1.95) [Kibdelosporangium sp. MJ126-NF4]